MTKARTLADNFAADINGITAGTGITGGGTSGTVTITNEMATTITAKGDLLAGTGNAAFDNLAAGASGETLVADSSTSTGLRYSAIPGANLLVNGSFDIWQRGTAANGGNQVYTADRWFTYSRTTASVSQETSVVPTGATNALKVNVTGANGFSNIQYAMEQDDVIKLRGQVVTFSVYLRADATYNGSFNMSIQSNTTGNTQTGGTWSTVSGASTSHTPSTSAFTRVSVTGTIPTNANGLAFYIGQNAVLANNSNYYIALAKAEIGSVATVWSRAGATLAGELAACKRYFEKNIATSTQGYAPFAMGYVNFATAANYGYKYEVEKRVQPTITFGPSVGQFMAGYKGNAGVAASTLTAANISKHGCNITLVPTGTPFTQGEAIMLQDAGSAVAYIEVSSEL